ncbi:hypothetical protein LIER_41792 [Lithospermum erythrorhizon]|uniref:Retrotransposon Copia-like N-terminal domain-containing protein n=1 Tax=Lithospermum erythrorhizon TaxID=34254 RepID=A0AAV3RI74_LITER
MSTEPSSNSTNTEAKKSDESDVVAPLTNSTNPPVNIYSQDNSSLKMTSYILNGGGNYPEWQRLSSVRLSKILKKECMIIQNTQKEKERVYEFLTGLNNCFDDTRASIIWTKSFPTTEEAFSEIRREESRRRIMLTNLTNQGTESSAIIANNLGQTKFQNQNQIHHQPMQNQTDMFGTQNQNPLIPTQQFQNQIVENQSTGDIGQLWTIKGEGWMLGKDTKEAAGAEELPGGGLHQGNQVIAQPSTQASTSFSGVAKPGNVLSFLASWIIHSGASDHMTSHRFLFEEFSSSLTPFPNLIERDNFKLIEESKLKWLMGV